MSTQTRIYLVTDTESGKKRLVRASNQPQAVRHAARNKFSVEVAGQDDLVSLVATGCPVEEAGADEQPETQEAQQ